MTMYTGVVRKFVGLKEDAIGEIVVKSPTEVQWKVPEKHISLAGKFFISSSFLFMDGEWRLIHDIKECAGGGLIQSLGLQRVHSPSNHTIKFRMGIEGEYESGVQEHEFKYDGDEANIEIHRRRWTWHYLRTMARQKVITFFCSFLSSSTETETSQKRPSKGADKLADRFEKLFLSGDHHDIIIKVQDQEIRAHKLIIVTRCPVFASMFRHDTIEKNTGVITIENCDPEIFREFLLFLYTGKLKNVSAENAIEIYVIADKYQVGELKSDCTQFMMKNMSNETFCDFISLALRHSETDLLNFATDYFVKNVKTIIVTVKWQSFHKEYPVESNELYIKGIAYLSPA